MTDLTFLASIWTAIVDHATGIFAALAFALSLWNLWRAHRENGLAALQVRLEMVTLNHGEPRCRVVVFNGGRGDAYDVAVVLEGENCHHEWKPIKKVMAQQAYPLAWNYGLNVCVPEEAEVQLTWKDRRFSWRHAWFYKTETSIPVYVAKYIRT